MATITPSKRAGTALHCLTLVLSAAVIMLAFTGCPTVRDPDPIRAALASSDNDALIAQKERELAAIQRRIDKAEADQTVGGMDALLGAVDDTDASQSGDFVKGLKGKGHMAAGGAQVAISAANLKQLREEKKKIEKQIRKLKKKNEQYQGGHFPRGRDHVSESGRDAIADATRGAARSGVPRDVPKPEVHTSQPEVHRPERAHHACFVGGTPIATPDGPRPIEEIKVGDLVLSYDAAEHRVVAQRVKSLISGSRTDLVEIRGKNGSALCSRNHPLFTASRQWKKASELAPESLLITRPDHAGVQVQVRAVRVSTRELDHPVPVFSFEVERTHNYFAGPDELLAHNTPPGGK